VIWTLPDGQTYITTPGSALLFPTLCVPNGEVPERTTAADIERRGEKTALMPLRTRTRAQNRATRIATERRHNRAARGANRKCREAAAFVPVPRPEHDEEPPPF
jgi:hypothetical protein